MFDYDVIPRSEATWESPARALNVAPGPRRLPRRLSAPRNDRGNLKRVLLFESGDHPTLQWHVDFSSYKLVGVFHEMGFSFTF